MIGKAKSLGQELSNNLQDTNEHASAEVLDSESRNHLALVNETLPYVCRTLSTRIAYLQHRQRTTSATATDKLRREEMHSIDEVLVFQTTARSPVANDLVRCADPSARSPVAVDLVGSAEPSARNCNANEPVRSAKPSARSPVARDSVRSVGNVVLSPQATVFRPQASDVVRSAVTSDVPDRSNATDYILSVVAADFLIFLMRLTWYVRLKTLPLLSTYAIQMQ